jgi:uncharacterized membrane protein YuzA (DUF378 family)
MNNFNNNKISLLLLSLGAINSGLRVWKINLVEITNDFIIKKLKYPFNTHIENFIYLIIGLSGLKMLYLLLKSFNMKRIRDTNNKKNIVVKNIVQKEDEEELPSHSGSDAEEYNYRPQLPEISNTKSNVKIKKKSTFLIGDNTINYKKKKVENKDSFNVEPNVDTNQRCCGKKDNN